jgi:hypothetical protein
LRQGWGASHRSQERGGGDAGTDVRARLSSADSDDRLGHAFSVSCFHRTNDHVGCRLAVNDISAVASSTPGISTKCRTMPFLEALRRSPISANSHRDLFNIFQKVKRIKALITGGERPRKSAYWAARESAFGESLPFLRGNRIGRSAP